MQLFICVVKVEQSAQQKLAEEPNEHLAELRRMYHDPYQRRCPTSSIAIDKIMMDLA